MLVVQALPVVEASPDYGWDLTLWLGEAFDFSIPFRPSLDQITRLLGEDPGEALTLPLIAKGEDFVEGKLRVGDDEVRTYFEFSLGYLSFTHPSREPLDFILGKIAPAMRVG